MMPKFTLIAEHTDFTGVRLQKNTLEFEDDYLGDILDNIKQFLQGTGFAIEGNLEIVPYESIDIPEVPDEIIEIPKPDYAFKQNYYREMSDD
jgi:hypothetical protein